MFQLRYFPVESLDWGSAFRLPLLRRFHVVCSRYKISERNFLHHVVAPKLEQPSSLFELTLLLIDLPDAGVGSRLNVLIIHTLADSPQCCAR